MFKPIDMSLAIVTYNNAAIIEDTIKSILSNIPDELTYKLYVIDNDSSDNTVALVRNIDPKIEIIQSENKGFGHGHNQVLEHIQSRYHFVINPDIALESKEQLRRMIAFLDENPDVGMLSPLILNPDHSIQYLCKTNPTVFDLFLRRFSPKLFPARQDRFVMKETGYDHVMPIEFGTGCFMVFRADLFREIGGFDTDFFMYMEDADITRRVNQVSKAVFFPEAQVIHYWQRESHKKIKYMFITIASMRIYFKKWGWKFI